MDTEAPFPKAQIEDQNACSTNGQNGFRNRHGSLEGDVTKEIHYLNNVLEENLYDSASKMNSNGGSPSEPVEIGSNDDEPSVLVTNVETAHVKKYIVEGKETAFTKTLDSSYTPHSDPSEMIRQNCKALSCEPMLTTIKKEARFELRAFQEEKKPSKLFDSSSERQPVRVKKVRPIEEMEELERERQELIRSQAVKKNPGIATKWWNPPPIKTVEEELDPDQLESHRKYQERKQKKPELSNTQQALLNQTNVSLVPVETVKNENLLIEQTDFSTTQNQFQATKQSNQFEGRQTDGLCSENLLPSVPEVTHVDKSSRLPILTHPIPDQGHKTPENATEVTLIETRSPADSTTEHTMIGKEIKEGSKARKYSGDFTRAKAVVTILKNPDLSSVNGLDDLSLQSQDTAAQESLSIDFDMDNVSDSGAFNEAPHAFLENSLGDYSFPATPQATSPVNKDIDGRTTPQSEPSMSPSYPGTTLTEEPAEYHAKVLVQNAIQQTISCQNDDWESIQTPKVSLPSLERYEEVNHETHMKESLEGSNVKGFIQPPPQICDQNTFFDTPQVSSPVHEEQDTTLENPAKVPPVSGDTSRPLMAGGRQSPLGGERQEYSYFSKYSEAAELRSTASMTQPRDAEVSSAPFRLRSHKQKTLSMIEEEIRAAQMRDEDLKRQRQAQGSRMAPRNKEKTTGHPTRLVVMGKTAPGKIEKVHCVALTSPTLDCPNSPTLSDVSSEGSEGSQRPKNFMQTLMEDYETNKVKRKEKIEDDRVLEAMRVTRRKSNMAVQWEAGVYTNQEEEE